MITAEQVKQLREMTGSGMMDCKRALEKTGGDMEAAAKALREQGLASAGRRAGRATGEGVIEAYIHPGSKLGVLVEVNCETDFVARTDQFLELAHELALQIAAANPRWVSRDDVPADIIDSEREILKAQAAGENKPANILDKIADGRISKFYTENCLLEQVSIRDDKITVTDLINQAIARLGENITVRQFARLAVGEQSE